MNHAHARPGIADDADGMRELPTHTPTRCGAESPASSARLSQSGGGRTFGCRRRGACPGSDGTQLDAYPAGMERRRRDSRTLPR
eukprot:gene10494-biopygen12322